MDNKAIAVTKGFATKDTWAVHWWEQAFSFKTAMHCNSDKSRLKIGLRKLKSLGSDWSSCFAGPSLSILLQTTMQLSQGRIWRESGNLSEIIPIPIWICPSPKYLSKLQNVFVKIAKCICPNCKMYLSKLPKYFCLEKNNAVIWG